MYSTFVIVLLLAVQIVLSQPLNRSEASSLHTENSGKLENKSTLRRILRSLSHQNFVAATNMLDGALSRIRTKRSSEEECEKLSLCKLHSKSGHSFLGTFELYFVNKENAKLWDHHTHTPEDCEQRYSGCSEAKAPTSHASAETRASDKEFRAEYSSEDYY